jgi:hypothetical protein
MSETISIEWEKQTFQSLEEFWRNGEDRSGLSDDEHALTGRYEEILNMLEHVGIWPPMVSPERNRFCAALREVLSRLPQEAFDKVDKKVRFLLDDPSLKMLAVNAPHPPSSALTGRVGSDTIVFFRTCLDLAPKALIGLIAHEIAHSFVGGKNYAEDEILAKKQAPEWGFGPELACLESEKERLFKPGSTPPHFSQE